MDVDSDTVKAAVRADPVHPMDRGRDRADLPVRPDGHRGQSILRPSPPNLIAVYRTARGSERDKGEYRSREAPYPPRYRARFCHWLRFVIEDSETSSGAGRLIIRATWRANAR